MDKPKIEDGISPAKLLEDSEAFNDFFFLPGSNVDYDPNDANQYVYFHELQELLNGGNNGGDAAVNEQSHGCNMNPVQMNNNDAVKDEGPTTNYVKRKRYKTGTVEYAQCVELRKIKNRETSARFFAAQKAHLEGLESRVKELREKNARLKKLLQIGISSLSSTRTRIQLRRTNSALL